MSPQSTFSYSGQFSTKEAYDRAKVKNYVWFYANGCRNQFWPITASIYQTKLSPREETEALLTRLKIAMADIIKACERTKNSNLDINLKNAVYAIDEITRLIKTNPIERIFFSSRFVEKTFRRLFKELVLVHPEIELTTLPSPSPRYVQMTKADKVQLYRKLLPTTSS